MKQSYVLNFGLEPSPRGPTSGTAALERRQKPSLSCERNRKPGIQSGARNEKRPFGTQIM